MAIEVEGPDGSVVEFPDGTSNEVIKGAMAKHFGSPTKGQAPVDNQKQTEDLPLATKALKALAFGATQTRSKDVDTLRRSGSLGFDLDKLDRTTDWMKQEAGLQNYDPASAHFADSSKPWTERIGYLPRTLLEGIPSMAQHVAASTIAGPIGMLGSTALTEGGSSVNRVREADKTDPNAELTTGQKLRVGGNVLTQAILNEVGGRATLGATAPVKAVGMEGVKQATGNVAKAAGVDAFVGGYGAGVDKALIEGKEPSVADVALPAVAGAAVGTAFRAPGALKETLVSTRNRALGDIEAQPRGVVADLYARYNGDHNLVSQHLNEEMGLATKGLDEVTKSTISAAKRDIAAGKRVSKADLESVGKASPEAAQVLEQLDAYGVIKSLDNGGIANSWLGRALNPFHRGSKEDTAGDKAASWFGKIADSGLVYHTMFGHISPEVAAAIAAGQGAGLAGLHGFDMLSGASNVPKVVVDKFAGTASPTQTIAEARASAFATDLAERQAKARAAQAEFDAAKTDEIATRLEGDIGNLATKRVQKLAKDRKAESDRKWKEASQSVRDQNKRDDIQAREESRVASEMRRQADLMRNSQRVEEQRQSQLLSDIGQQIRIQKNSESASSTPAALPLAVARLKAEYARNAEAANAPLPPEPTYNPEAMEWGPSSSLAGTPAARAITATKALERHNRKVAKDQAAAQRKEEKQKSEAAQAKAAKRVKDAEEKTTEAIRDADENMYVFEHRGQKAVVPKEYVGNPKTYRQSFAEKTDRRLDMLKGAKSLTKDKNVHRMIDQLANDWTDTTNNIDLAYGHLERIANKPGVPKAVTDYLLDNWIRVEGTWATARRDIEND